MPGHQSPAKPKDGSHNCAYRNPTKTIHNPSGKQDRCSTRAVKAMPKTLAENPPKFNSHMTGDN